MYDWFFNYFSTKGSQETISFTFVSDYHSYKLSNNWGHMFELLKSYNRSVGPSEEVVHGIQWKTLHTNRT